MLGDSNEPTASLGITALESKFFIIMGVSGCGKTTVGRALSAKLDWEFYDGDNFHPPENIAKMAAGYPLDDADRAPWLVNLHDLISSCLRADRNGILACSALKAAYRQVLLQGNPGVQVIYLKGNYDLILSRMTSRAGHYMKAEMLKSQFETLEEPDNCLEVDISLPVDEIISQILFHTRPMHDQQ